MPIGHSSLRERFCLVVFLVLIPVVWLAVLTLLAALCRVASYDNVEYVVPGEPAWAGAARFR
jgi:hypothetical protein